MRLTRRGALAGGAALLAFGTPSATAQSVTRRFDLVRDGSDIGGKTLAVTRDGDTVSVAIEIDIAVTLLGIPAFTYALRSREVWQGGRLASLEADTRENGSQYFARARRDGDALMVEGSAFTGRVDGNPATTSYWTPAFLDRPVWISTQDGRPFGVTARNLGTETVETAAGAVAATRWRIDGDLALDLFFDANGEWVGNEFDARGTSARFVLASLGAPLAPLWVNA